MLTVTKTSSSKEVESNPNKNHIRLNCDWEIEKIVAYFKKPYSNKQSFKSFLGKHAELLFINYVRELLEQGNAVTVVLEMGRCAFEGPRLLEKCGANVHLVPVSKLDLVSNRKRVKTDKLDAKFLSKLDLSETAKVWIPKRSQWDKRKLLEIREHKLNEVNRVIGHLRSFIALCPLRPEYINKKLSTKQWREKISHWQREFPDLYSDVM